jgi:hypothetical protein
VQHHSGAAICASLWLVVSVVTFSSFDAVVHMTPSVTVLVVSIVVLHLLVPPSVHFDVVCACSHIEWVDGV